MTIPNDCSWIWRKILKLRPVAIQHVKFIVGNGKSINLWFDPWIDGTPLAFSSLSPLISNSGLGCNATVSDIIRSSNWYLPNSNHHSIIEFRNDFDYSRLCNSEIEDHLLWDTVKAANLPSAAIWDSIRRRGNPVNWFSFTFCKILPPRMSFILWLAFHRGLRTKDRLIQFGLEINPSCELCNVKLETFNHLFFDCPFSHRVLIQVLRFCGWKGFSSSWSSITDYIISCPASTIRTNLLILGLAATVYYLWQERNARIHKDRKLPVRVIIIEIMEIIKSKLCSFRKFQKMRVNLGLNHLFI